MNFTNLRRRSYTKFFHVRQIILSFAERFYYLCSMTKKERILRRLYPGREVFTPEEVAFAMKAMQLVVEENRNTVVPSKDVAIGARFIRGGIEYECVPRPIVGVRDACMGCSFAARPSCSAPRCSKFDRSDGKFVWFKRVK